MIDKAPFYAALCAGRMEDVEKLTLAALETDGSADAVLKQGLIAAMEDIGVQFKNCEIYIPEVLVAARAMHAGMALLKPHLSKSSGSIAGKVVVGTVKGDLHDIGKNLVVMMMQGVGFEVIDLGIDVPVAKFIAAVETHQPNVLGMSALLTTTMKEMQNTVEAIHKAGLTGKVKTIVGGAPVTEGFARDIGADGYAPDAASGAERAKALVAR
jgi:5-methyltetrahydrofolate--homocysteine methyltransferase